MTTAETAQGASNVGAAASAPSKPKSNSKTADSALASSSALFSENSRSEWELLLTALTVIGDDDGAGGGGEGAEKASSSRSSGDGQRQQQPSPSSSSSTSSSSSPSFPALASAAARGDYSLAFTTGEARRILIRDDDREEDKEEDDEDEAARRYWSSVADACCSPSSSLSASSPSSAAASSLERLALGASALLAFVQAAFTGPELEPGTPKELAEGKKVKGKQKQEEEKSLSSPSPPPSSSSSLPLPPGGLPLSALDAAALESAGANGESVDPRVKGAQFLAVAVAVLLAPLGLADGSSAGKEEGAASPSSSSSSSLAATLSQLPPTWSLWALRTAFARQRVLGAPAAVTRDALDLLSPFAAAAVELASSSSSSSTNFSSSSSNSSSSSSNSSSSLSPLSAAQALLASAGAALEAAACRLELRESSSSSSSGDSSSSFSSPAFLRRAAEALKVSVSVTGALGVRTVHQGEARAQLVVRVLKLEENEKDKRGGRGGEEEATTTTKEFVRVAGGDDLSSLFSLDEESSPSASSPSSTPAPGADAAATALPAKGLSGLAAERSEVLTAPRLGGGGGEEKKEGNSSPSPSPPLAFAAAASAPLTPPVQALLLLHASAVRRGTADDGLRAWRAAPFVEALSTPSQQEEEKEGGEGEGGKGEATSSSSLFLPLSRSRWAVAACAALARARHELTRPRTRERALLAFERLSTAQMEKKSVEGSGTEETVSSSLLVARRRVPLALATPLPPSHRARKEAADALLSAGLVSEALDVYESVEAWEASALCHRLLGHAERARATLEARIEAASKRSKTANSSRLLLPALLCSLGDVTGDASRYEEAWRLSRGRCARAQRAWLAALRLRKTGRRRRRPGTWPWASTPSTAKGGSRAGIVR